MGDPENVCDDDCSALRYVCESVSRRASMMASAGITALLKKMDYKDVVIAIDGSLFRFHPHFKNVMQSRISQMMGINYKFDLLEAQLWWQLFSREMRINESLVVKKVFTKDHF